MNKKGEISYVKNIDVNRLIYLGFPLAPKKRLTRRSTRSRQMRLFCACGLLLRAKCTPLCREWANTRPARGIRPACRVGFLAPDTPALRKLTAHGGKGNAYSFEHPQANRTRIPPAKMA